MIATLVLFGLSIPLPPAKPDPVRAAVRLAVPQLVAGATGHAEKKSCFACHNQAYPALALAAARDARLRHPGGLLLETRPNTSPSSSPTNKKQFLDGKGTGGQTATASYALFTLELAGHKPDDTTAAVAQYLLELRADSRLLADDLEPPADRIERLHYYIRRDASAADIRRAG